MTRYLTCSDLMGTDRMNSDLLQRFKEERNIVNDNKEQF